MNKPIIPHIPFYFIRHGQTDWNVKKMIQGHTDIPLNAQGIAQAQAATALLANLGITRIISSPLARAHKTADIINEMFQVQLHTHDGLKERYLGALEGTVKTTSALSNINTNYTQMAQDSECIDAFKKRIANALHEMLHPDHITLIVAHGGVYWALMHMLGFENQASTNAVPHFFSPTEKEDRQWLVCPINQLSAKGNCL